MEEEASDPAPVANTEPESGICGQDQIQASGAEQGKQYALLLNVPGPVDILYRYRMEIDPPENAMGCGESDTRLMKKRKIDRSENNYFRGVKW